MGKLSAITDDDVERVLTYIAKGNSVRSAARKFGIPHRTLDSRLNSESVAARYARAREDRAWSLAEKAIEMVEDQTLDPNEKRVRLDAYKWFASKLSPRGFGGRLDLKAASPDSRAISFTMSFAPKPAAEVSPALASTPDNA